jgi:hypothetical protein
MDVARFALVVVFALGGCCSSGTGCIAPRLQGGPVAWDGLGEAPPENTRGPGPKRSSRRSKEVIVGPLNDAVEPAGHNLSREERWAREDALSIEADKRVTREMKICSSC